MKKPVYPKFKDSNVIRRKFLNKKEGLAAVETNVSIEHDSVSASVDISDCSRKISLDFYIYNAKEKTIKERLTKLTLLIDTLTEFRNDFIYATEEIRCRQPLYDAYRVEKRAWQKFNNKQPSTLDELIEDL